MKIKIYTSLEEKRQIISTKGFDYKRIDNKGELVAWIKANRHKSWLFRGMPEAYYKNYTTAQRAYIINEIGTKHNIKYYEFISRQLFALDKQNGGVWLRYYESLGIVVNDMLKLSFLQHYRGATPLLDFTKNLYIGLYFMQDGSKFPPKGDNDIENYCSLYYRKPSDINISNVIDETIKDVKAKLVGNISRADLKEAIKLVVTYSLEMLMNAQKPLFLDNNISSKFSKRYAMPNQIAISNLNLVAQDGCFVLWGDELNPLEDMNCIDIHKSLLPTIREILESRKINHDSIYPQEETIAQLTLKESLIL